MPAPQSAKPLDQAHDLENGTGTSARGTNIGRGMKKIGVIAVALVGALLISVANGAARTSDASHCQYAKLFRGWQGVHGTIYLRLAITPRNPTACRVWDGKYFGGGRLFREKLGTGVMFCKLLDKSGSQRVTLGVFADTPKAGHAFCRAFHPHWTRL
jgi:hypothetical protein